MPLKLIVAKKAQKELSKIDQRYQLRILAALAEIEVNPFIGKKLEGQYKEQRSFDIRPYRIIYEVHKNELIILVIKIQHRQGVYK